jgi:hypothetical protein
MEATKPRVVVNTDVEIKITPKILTVMDKKYEWVALVKKFKNGLEITVYMKGNDGNLSRSIYYLNDPAEIINLDLRDDIKSGISVGLQMWEERTRREEAEILTNSIPVIPEKISEKELLSYWIANAFIARYGATGLKYKVHGLIVDAGIYCYDKAWYNCEEMLDLWLNELLTESQKMKFTKSVREEVKNKIRILNPKIIDISNNVLLSFENYVLNIECFISTGDFRRCVRSHSSDLYVFHHIPHQLNLELIDEVRKGLEVYIPPRNGDEVLKMLKGLSPKVYEFLRSLTYFKNIDPTLHESRVLFLLEMFGRGLIPGYNLFGSIVEVFKNIFVVLGPGNTGKSTMLRNFYGDLVLGERNYSLINLGKLGSSDHDLKEREAGKLYKKNPLVVMHLDLDKHCRIYDWGIIRQVSGGDPIPARILYHDSFDYRPAWKMYISTNDPPPINLEGAGKEALLNRIKAIEFKNIFRDSLNIKSLFNERDIEALIITSLYAIKLTYDRGQYSFTGIRDVEDVLDRYTYPEYRVVMELVEVGRLEFNPVREIYSKDLYNICVEYVNELKKNLGNEADEEEFEKRYSLPSQEVFTKNLKRKLAKYGVKTVSDGPYTVFKGIGLKREGMGSLHEYSKNQ